MGRPVEHNWLFNFPKQDAEMRRLIEDGLFYAPWIGDTETAFRTNTNGTRTKEIVATSGQIIERIRGIADENTDSAVIPLQLPLEAPPLTGNAYYPGTGEKLQFQWSKCFINQIGKVVELQTGLMEKLRTDDILKLYDRARPALVRFMRRWLNAEFISAFYDGHSMNVTEGLNTSPEGIGANRVFHPNLYVNNIVPATGAGAIAAVGNARQNKTTAQIQASNIVAGVPEQASDFFLDELAIILDELGIQKAASYQGRKFWLVVCDRWAFRRFKQNTTLRNDWAVAFMGKEYDNPLFGHETWIFGEFMFVIDKVHPRAWDNVSQDFAGANGYINAPTVRGSSAHRIINVLGENSLGWADAVPFQTRIHEDNFGLFKEMLQLLICGVRRAEYVAETNYPQYFASSNNVRATLEQNFDVINQGSLAVAVGI